MFDDKKVGSKLAKKLCIEEGDCEFRNFPDEETYIRVKSNVKKKHIVLICFLDHPNKKILSLYFLAKTLKELGASKITLVIPYLPYMRQDKQFQIGEAVTSHLFAQLISSFCDSLITIDPHLHRIKNISEIYSTPTMTLHATSPISIWINNNIKNPLIIGPDEESAQWGKEIAKLTRAPFVLANKKRLADREVIIDLPTIHVKSHTPVIVDDIISSGTTMRELIKHLAKKNLKKPICIGIHPLFEEKTYKKLIKAGAKEIISCNTILHPSNHIDIINILIKGIKQC